MELLVVIGIIAVLMALGLPAMKMVREHGAETVCRSNLRQMAVILRTYTSDHDGLFPNPLFIYHSEVSFDPYTWGARYIPCCRWHDARIGLRSALLVKEHPELRGSLWSYLGNPDIVLCKVGKRANLERNCNNACCSCIHDPRIDVIPQYTCTMNAFLGTTVQTCGSTPPGVNIDPRSLRDMGVQRESHVMRSPSEVFVFGEENSWAVNIDGVQPLYSSPHWPAEYELSGKISLPDKEGYSIGTLRLPALQILSTYQIKETALTQDNLLIGDAFATYHRVRHADLNTGHSYTVMLDGHVRKVTVQDQLRRSRQVQTLGESHLGPGGNLTLAWPIDIPPPGGWENQ